MDKHGASIDYVDGVCRPVYEGDDGRQYVTDGVVRPGFPRWLGRFGMARAAIIDWGWAGCVGTAQPPARCGSSSSFSCLNWSSLRTPFNCPSKVRAGLGERPGRLLFARLDEVRRLGFLLVGQLSKLPGCLTSRARLPLPLRLRPRRCRRGRCRRGRLAHGRVQTCRRSDPSRSSFGCRSAP